MEGFLIYWALPALICMFVMIRTVCFVYDKQVKEISDTEWYGMFLSSAIYPLGYCLVISMIIMSGALTKDIKEFWKK